VIEEAFERRLEGRTLLRAAEVVRYTIDKVEGRRVTRSSSVEILVHIIHISRFSFIWRAQQDMTKSLILSYNSFSIIKFENYLFS